MEPKKLFWKTIGIACALILVLFGGLLFLKSSIDDKANALQQTRADILAKQEALQTLAQLQVDSQKAAQYSGDMDTFLIKQDDLLTFAKDLGLMIQQAGFSGAPRFKDEAIVPGAVQKTGFTMTIDGGKGVNDVAKLLVSIEKSKYFVHFNALDMTQDTAAHLTADGYVVSFNIK